MLAGARGLSAFGDQVAIVTLLLRVHDTGGGPRGITMLLVLSALPAGLLSPIAGRLADTVDSRRVTLAAALTQAGVCLALALMSSTTAAFALVVVLQTADALAAPAWSAWLPYIAGAEGTPQALGLTQATVTAAGLAGPAAGGILTGVGGSGLPLLVDAATFLLLAAGSLAIRNRRGALWRAAGSPAPRQLDGFRALLGDALLRPLTLTVLGYILVGEAVNVADVFLIRNTLHGSAAAYGLIGTAATAGIVIGSLLGGRLGRRETLLGTIIVSAAIQALAMAAVGLAPSLIFVTFAWIVVGIANGTANATIPALVLRRVPNDRHGRALGALNGLGRTLSVLALGLGYLALTTVGPRTSFVLSATFALAAISPILLHFPGLTRHERDNTGR
jgi:MFS family permease